MKNLKLLILEKLLSFLFSKLESNLADGEEHEGIKTICRKCGNQLYVPCRGKNET